MTEAERIPVQRRGGKPLIYKAWVISALLHLVLLMLIQPARWSGPGEVVLEARLASAQAKTSPDDVKEVEPPQSAPAQPPKQAPIVPIQTRSVPPPATPAQSPETEVSAAPPGEPHAEIMTASSAARDEVSNLPLPELPLLVDTRWYTAREVERRPEPMGEIRPLYPEAARQRGIEGSVVVALHIDEAGEVREVEILESNPPGVFDAAVLAAYGQARFTPAARGGQPVRYLGRYRVLFELE